MGNSGAYLYRLIGNVPFLNGGLFERGELDARDEVTVPDEVIETILRDLFDRFNFTVMESTPFDVEVAVDLKCSVRCSRSWLRGGTTLARTTRPDPSSSFMCREALKGYLEGCDTGLPPEEIARFVDERDTSGLTLSAAPKLAEALDEVTVVDPACGSGAYLLGMMQELVDLQITLYNVGVDPARPV